MTQQEQINHLQEFTDKMGSILISKRNDYSSDSDVLSNFKMVAKITGTTAEQVVLNLISVKVVRLGNLIGNDKIPNNESIQDNLLDLANYTVLLNMVRSEPQIKVY